MNDMKNIVAIKDKIATLEKQSIENQALQKKVLKDLKDLYKFDSIKQAQKYVDKTKQQLITNKEKLQNEYDKFITKYGEKLGIN